MVVEMAGMARHAIAASVSRLLAAILGIHETKHALVGGTTVIDHHGNLLAVGAILQIPSGSEGGGRLAAAKALSTKGVGIKISQDGGIRCYHDNGNGPVVFVMQLDTRAHGRRNSISRWMMQ